MGDNCSSAKCWIVDASVNFLFFCMNRLSSCLPGYSCTYRIFWQSGYLGSNVLIWCNHNHKFCYAHLRDDSIMWILLIIAFLKCCPSSKAGSGSVYCIAILLQVQRASKCRHGWRARVARDLTTVRRPSRRRLLRPVRGASHLEPGGTSFVLEFLRVRSSTFLRPLSFKHGLPLTETERQYGPSPLSQLPLV